MATATQQIPFDVAEIISEAIERCGLDPTSLEHGHLVSARRSLYLALLDIEGQDINEANYKQRQSQDIPAGRRVILLPDDTIDVLDAVTILNGNTLQLQKISRQDDLILTARTQQGRPTAYWVARTADVDLSILGGSTGTAYGTDAAGYGTWGGTVTTGAAVSSITQPLLVLWPVPEQTYTLSYDRLRMIRKPGTLSDKPDTMRNWCNAICASLAWRMAVKLAPDRAQGLKAQYEEDKARAMIESRERGEIVISARGFGRSRRGRY